VRAGRSASLHPHRAMPAEDNPAGIFLAARVKRSIGVRQGGSPAPGNDPERTVTQWQAAGKSCGTQGLRSLSEGCRFMPFATFEQFGAELCSAARVPLPDLQPDRSGLLAFRLAVRDVMVDLLHWTSPDNDDVFILVTFGAIQPGKELETMRLLAEANFECLSSQAPVFGSLPNGDVVMRQLISLRKAIASETLSMIGRFASLVRQWRQNPTMQETRDGHERNVGQALSSAQLFI